MSDKKLTGTAAQQATIKKLEAQLQERKEKEANAAKIKRLQAQLKTGKKAPKKGK